MEIPPGLDAMALRAEARQDAENVVCQRLLAWLCATPRQDAATAFTAGPLRDLAREIEQRLAEPAVTAISAAPVPPADGPSVHEIVIRLIGSAEMAAETAGHMVAGLERACTEDDWQMPEMVMTTPRRVS